MFKDKRGLSTIVVTLILIVLSLVAVGVVWVVVSNLLNTGTQQASSSFGQLFLSLKIQSAVIYPTGNIQVVIQRDTGAGDLKAINFIVSDGKNSNVIKKSTTMQELGTQTFVLSSSETGMSGINKISIAPVVNSNGQETIGNILDNYDFKDMTLKFVTTHSSGTNPYTYYKIASSNYVIVSGDYLEYDVYCETSSPVCDAGTELDFTNSNGRSLGLVDQNSISNNFGGTSEAQYASGKWYHRKVNLTPAIGKTMSAFDLVEESDTPGNYISYYRNIGITNGGNVQSTIYQNGAPSISQINYANLASNYGVSTI